MSLASLHKTADVAEALGVSPRYLATLVKRGVVRPIRIGDRVNAPMRFDDADVEAIKAALREPEPVESIRRRRRRRAS